MSIRVEFNRSELQFEGLPFGFVPYSSDGEVSLTVADSKTTEVSTVFFQKAELTKADIPIELAEQMADLLGYMAYVNTQLTKLRPLAESMLKEELMMKHHLLDFLRDEKLFCSTVSKVYFQRLVHTSENRGPGIYLCSLDQIFINLKKRPIHRIGFVKVRKVLWLNAKSDADAIVAMKVERATKQREHENLINEMEALDSFSGARGIVQKIASTVRFHKDKIKCINFFPLYEIDLFQFIIYEPFRLSPSDQLGLMENWLHGLAAIAKVGIHADMKSQNLLLRRREGKVEGVITDFGAFKKYGKERSGDTTPQYASPEYWNGIVTSKLDVWGLGCSFLELVSNQPVIAIRDREVNKLKKWSSRLKSHWSYTFIDDEAHPPFVVKLIDEMLEPNMERRLTAELALKYF